MQRAPLVTPPHSHPSMGRLFAPQADGKIGYGDILGALACVVAIGFMGWLIG